MEENTQETNQPAKMNPMLVTGVIFAVLIIGAVVVLGMGTSNTSEEPAPSQQSTAIASTVSSPTPTVEGTTDESVKTFNLEGKNFRFTPNEIKVKKGDKVKVTLKVADMQHDFVVDELNVRTKTGKAGETVEVEFTADTAGEYEFYCSVSNHRAQGMVGTLIVEE